MLSRKSPRPTWNGSRTNQRQKRNDKLSRSRRSRKRGKRHDKSCRCLLLNHLDLALFFFAEQDEMWRREASTRSQQRRIYIQKPILKSQISLRPIFYDPNIQSRWLESIEYMDDGVRNSIVRIWHLDFIHLEEAILKIKAKTIFLQWMQILKRHNLLFRFNLDCCLSANHHHQHCELKM